MSRLLVHLASGPEHPTRAALAFLVARTAASAGHEVSVFLAGDGVAFLRDPTMDATHGIGTGSVREHYAALVEAGGRIYASGMSSKARGVDAAAAGDKAVEFVPPDRLVELIMEADRVVTY
jgi:predicted peroxiredoxin